MKIYIDEELPKSCASCQFLVHCDQCEGTENYCPFVGCVGHDPSDTLMDGAPITPARERHEECPLEQRPHGEWEIYFNSSGTLMRKCTRCGHEFNQNSDAQNFCPNCGADMRKQGDEK